MIGLPVTTISHVFPASCVGGPAAAVQAFWFGPPWNTVLLVTVVVAVLAVLIPVLMKRIRKIKVRRAARKRQDELQVGVQESGAAGGGAAVDPQVLRSRIDQMRKTVQNGLKQYRGAGKSVYGAPWYLLAGEPGAGKTEAMRRSDLAFLPGAQDLTQGVGGTTSMHWWFTGDGVVLDVAGRVVFANWDGAGDAEWRALLRMLRKARRRCPINGIVLAIPADSLLDDDGALIDRKAKLLADELRTLQSSLGLCLPVYVAITKTDTVAGFREFFAHLELPQQRFGLLGWSSPGPGGSPFDADEITRFFGRLGDSLTRYRSSVLMFPRVWETVGRTRTELVDSLYALPDAIRALAPRVNRYLEMIFAHSRWAGDPKVYLRGLYFTSASPTGAPAGSAPAGEAVKSDLSEPAPPASSPRSYFLRDLFQAKVFPEAGLVQTAPNARRRKRLPWLAATTACLAAAVMLGVFTATGYQDLQDDVATERTDWQEVRSLQALQEGHGLAKSPIIVAEGDRHRYAGGDVMYGISREEPIERDDYLERLYEQANQRTRLPFGFRISGPRDGTLRNNLFWHRRRDVYRVVFSEMVFLPLVNAVRREFLNLRATDTQEVKDWPDCAAATPALAQLLQMEQAWSDRQADPKVRLASERAYNLKPLSAFVLRHDASNTLMLDDVVGVLPANGPGWDYDARNPDSAIAIRLGSGYGNAQKAIQTGTDSFCKTWTNVRAYRGTLAMPGLLRLAQTLEDYDTAEEGLLQLAKRIEQHGNTPWTAQECQDVLTDWARRYARLAGPESLAGLLEHTERSLGADANRPVQDLFAEAEKVYRRRLLEEFDTLLPYTVVTSRALDPEHGQFLAEIQGKLKRNRQRAREELNETVQKNGEILKRLAPKTWAPHAGGPRGFRARLALYQKAGEIVNQGILGTRKARGKGTADLVSLEDDLQSAQRQLNQIDEEIDRLAKTLPKGAVSQRAVALVKAVARLAREKINHDRIAHVLTVIPPAAEEIREEMKSLAGGQEWFRPPLKLTPFDKPGEFERGYHPLAAAKYLAAWEHLVSVLDQKGPSALAMLDPAGLRRKRNQVQQVVKAYEKMFLKYWSSGFYQAAQIRKFSTWAEYHREITSLRAYQINGALRTIDEQIIRAVTAVPPADPKTVDQVLRECNGELALLTPIYNKVCQDTLANWSALGPDPAKARAQVLSMSERQRIAALLGPYGPEQVSRIRYWSQLIERGFETLGEGAQKAAVAAVARLAEDYMAFPLCNTPNRSRVLSPGQVAEASKWIRQIVPLAPPPAPATTTQKAAPQARPKTMGPIAAQLARLRGEGAIKDPVQKQWLENLLAVLAALHDAGKTPLKWELIVPPPEAQRLLPALPLPAWSVAAGVDRHRYLEVYCGGERLGSRIRTASPDGKPILPTKIAERAAAEDLELRFFKDAESQEPAAVIRADGAWSAVSLLVRDGVRFDPKLKAFLVPLFSVDTDNYNCYYWVGLRFNRPVPMPSNWPTPETWPTARTLRTGHISVPGLNHQLALLLKSGQLAQHAQDDLARIDAVLSRPHPSVQPVWTPVVLGRKTQSRPPQFAKRVKNLLRVADRFRYMEVHVAGKRVGRRFQTAQSTGRIKRQQGIRIPLKAGKVEFLFFEYSEEEKPSARFAAAQPWAGLRLLLRDLAQAGPDEKHFLVPLLFKDPGGKPYYYWLGLAFDFGAATPASAPVVPVGDTKDKGKP